VIRDYNRNGKTIVITTHYMDEADTLCERVAIIDHGKIIAKGTPQELKASIPGGYLLRLRFDRVSEELLAQLRALPGVSEVRAADATATDLRRSRRNSHFGYREFGPGRGRGAPRRAHFRT
jgi:ABC-2 type transport system ATP-binding protein